MARTLIRSFFIALLFATATFAQSGARFVALDHWKAAVLSGNPATLKQLYSSDPPARVSVVTKTSTDISVDADAEFWSGLKPKRVSLKLGQSRTPQPGIQQVTFEATIVPAPPGRTVYVLESQIWQQQSGAWRLVALQRTEPYKLEQPLSLDAKIYPPASVARQEIQQATATAAKDRKRVLVIFGADWCYDCHVLDKALLRSDVAPILNANFQVVHVDVGQGDKNQDLMNEYQVPMSRGIPALAVLDSNGKLLYSQRNGEFERARAMGPEDLVEFLRKWKPQTR